MHLACCVQVVLPRETTQFPQRLVANAWDLCDHHRQPSGGEDGAVLRPVGFSGTDDNKLLLPLRVKQLDTHAHEVRLSSFLTCSKYSQSTDAANEVASC